MSRYAVTFHSQAEIVAGEVSAAALISIVGYSDAAAVVDPARFDGRILRLAFDDTPWPEPWQSDRGGPTFIGPTLSQVEDALAFSRQIDGPIAVHCQKGQSRSTAVALAILADRSVDALRAVRMLLQTARDMPSADVALALLDGKSAPRPRPRLQPNPGIVRHAETVMDMHGQLDHALCAECPDYRSWRQFWIDRGWR